MRSYSNENYLENILTCKLQVTSTLEITTSELYNFKIGVFCCQVISSMMTRRVTLQDPSSHWQHSGRTCNTVLLLHNNNNIAYTSHPSTTQSVTQTPVVTSSNLGNITFSQLEDFLS